MKAGLTIEELATEIMRQRDANADYIVNSSKGYCRTYVPAVSLFSLKEDFIRWIYDH